MYQTAVVNLKSFSKDKLNKKIKIFRKNYENQINKSGIIWILCDSILNKNEFFHSPFYIAEKFSDLYLKNVIIAPSFRNFKKNLIFNNYVTNILFLSKDEKYYFNKDPIRETHIWKNVEWGKRKKNYNPKGKDPGNVWMKTKDDGKANIIEHCPLSFEDVVERCYLSASKPKDDVLLININKIKSKKKIKYVTI